MKDKINQLGAKSEQTVDEDLVARGMRWWREQRPDIDSSGKAIVGRISLLQDLALRRINEGLARHGVRYQEYGVLATLRSKGPPFQMSPSELQASLIYSSGGLSNLLKRLERGGYIGRSEDPSDGRAVRVKLTAKGKRLADQAMPDHAQVELGFIQALTARQREQLAALLAQLMKAQDTAAVEQLAREPSTVDGFAAEGSTAIKSSARRPRRKA